LEAPPQQIARVREKTKVETKEVTKTEVEEKKKEKEKVEKEKKKKEKKKKKPRVLKNALFAGIGMARRLCFIVDCSGSMQAMEHGGMTRLEIVQMQLVQMLDTMEGQRGCAFGLLMFTHNMEVDAQLGNSMWPATARNVEMGKQAVMRMTPHGGNGAEAECLRESLTMGPQTPEAVFFLGDGGWSANDLIREASNAIPARITLHGIAFFIGGGDDGGLSTIAAMTGGGFRNITDARQVTEAEPVEAEKETVKRNAWTNRIEPDSDDSEEEGRQASGKKIGIGKRKSKKRQTDEMEHKFHKLPRGTPWGAAPQGGKPS